VSVLILTVSRHQIRLSVLLIFYGLIVYRTVLKVSNVGKDSLYIFLDYVVQINYQQMSHAVKTVFLVKIKILDNWHF
jgi:hypothetical protein